MKVILYMAVSVNGYITHGKDDSDWVSKEDWKEFDKLKRESGVMVMGKNTFQQFQDDFPQDGALNIVMTHDKNLLEKKINNVFFTDKTPKELVAWVVNQGFNQLMIIGGMTLNTSFVKENLIDEVWLSVHPIFIGQGKTVVEKFDTFKKLTFLGFKELSEGLVQLRYKIK
jgi:dihydrofolate reductase